MSSMVVRFVLASLLAMATWGFLPPQPRHTLAGSRIDVPWDAAAGSLLPTITVLPNGNFVVTDPAYAIGPSVQVGAVYLFSGETGAVISRLTGSQAYDRVGTTITVLANGNFVIQSEYWRNGSALNAGAVTWASAVTGVTGTVSALNSFVGATMGDEVGVNVYACGNRGVVPLANGDFVICSPHWDAPGAANAGAVTFVDGQVGITGTPSINNSVIGSTANDYVGMTATALTNGRVVLSTASWDNGGQTDVGAVTWTEGTPGLTGTISLSNSLVGSAAGNQIGNRVVALPGGDYLVVSPGWDNGALTDAGAVTRVAGGQSVTGVITTTNSLTGAAANHQIGAGGVTVLTNGHYVVQSPYWDDGAVPNAGAVTWMDGTQPTSGTVDSTNSLVGSHANDHVGSIMGITPLTNGHYVVASYEWDNGAALDAGAVTWADGTAPLSGPISAANSLVGTGASDQVGGQVVALTNGHYVTKATGWNNGAVSDAGAVTWGNGWGGTVGAVSASNSLVGSQVGDRVGIGLIALTNGHYAVGSSLWDNGAVADAGAVTWGDGTQGVTGTISSLNSLVGSTATDNVGGVIALSDGAFAVDSPNWSDGAVAHVGAVTWASGIAPLIGTISAANSLIGLSSMDRLGYAEMAALPNGDYAFRNDYWSATGTPSSAGAITWARGGAPLTGTLSTSNSVMGSTNAFGRTLAYAYDPVSDRLIVARPADRLISIFRASQRPVAEAGADQRVVGASAVQLDGAASADPDLEGPLTYHWIQQSGPTVPLDDATLATPAFQAPTGPATLVFNLIVTDAAGLSSLRDSVTVEVEAGPTATATSTATPTATATGTPTSTATPSPSSTPTPTSTQRAGSVLHLPDLRRADPGGGGQP